MQRGSVQEFWSCLTENSLLASDILQDGDNRDWSPEFTYDRAGIHYRYNKTFTMTSLVSFSLNMTNTSFGFANLILHDPEYFLTNSNPVSIPKIKIEVDFGYGPIYLKGKAFLSLNFEITPNKCVFFSHKSAK